MRWLCSILILFSFRLEAASLQLTLASDGMSVGGLALQWALSGLTPGAGNYYSCEVATNGTTFYQSNVTASAYWNITVANNQTWKFRIQSIIGGVGQLDFSATNSVYGDSKPENVSISSSSTTSILLAFKNLSTYETGFLAEQATNASFVNSRFYNVGPTPQVPTSAVWPQTYNFLPDTTYYYRLYATNNSYTIGGSTNPMWLDQIGGTNNDSVFGTTFDSVGNVCVAGYFSSTIAFKGATLINQGLQDIFIAKLNPNGGLIWVTNFGSTGNDVGRAIAVDASDNVMVAGSFQGTVNFGITNFTSNGQSDVVVLKLNGVTGAVVWANNFGGTGDDLPNGIAADSTGKVFITGQFGGTIDFGQGPLTSAGNPDIFFAGLSSAGVGVWSRRYGSTGEDIGSSVAVDSGGNPVMVGHFMGTNNFGGGNRKSTFSGVGSPTTMDTVILKLAGLDGSYVWDRTFNNNSQNRAYGVALDLNSNVFVTGSFEGSIDAIGGFTNFITSAGAFDIFIGKFSGATGTNIWLQRFGNTDSEEGFAVGTDPGNGDVLVTGYFRGAVNFGGGPIISFGSDDVWASRLTGSGTWLWTKRFGSSDSDRGFGASVDSHGNAVVVGQCFGGNFGWTNIVTAGLWDGFITTIPSTSSNVVINAGITLPSVTVSISPNQTPPPALLFVSRTTDTQNQIVNTWNSGGGSINNWILQESIGNTTSWTTVAAPVDDPVNGMSFTANSLTPGTVYYWRVYATNGAGVSAILTNRVDMPIAGNATGGNWFIDIAALTNGSNLSGTNWANAWPNLSSASWFKVSAGIASPQNIWVAKGSYNEYGVCMTPGSGALVTLHAATNAAQKGLASFLSITPYRNRFIINGSMDDTFVVPTGAYPALFNITNNQGISIASLNGAIARGIYSPTDSTSNQIFWCRIGPVGIFHTGLGESDQSGVGFINTTSGGSEVAYCYLSDIFGTGISINGGQEAYGTIAVHHNVIDLVHCNFVVTGYGADVYNNYMLSVALPQIGHPDGYQPAAAWTRFCNNYVKNVPNGRLFYPEMFRTNNDPNIMVTGNLFWFDLQQPAEAIDFTTEPLAYNGGSVAWPSMTFSNILIANNTMVNLGTSMNARKSDVTNLFVKSFWFLNNVVAGDGGGTSLINIGAPQDTVSYISPTYDSTQVIVDKNLIENGLIRYNSNVTSVAGLPFTHNTVAAPGFVASGNFHMTNALAGSNLTVWASQCPFLSVDMEGVTRTTWQVGAFESVSNSQVVVPPDPQLKMWLSFNTWQGQGFGVIDDSGNLNNAYSFSDFTNSPSLTNHQGWGNAAAFLGQWPWPGPPAEPAGSIKYLAVTNCNGIMSLTNGTISAWAWFMSNSISTSSIFDSGYSDENNSWNLGRYFSYATRFTVWTNGVQRVIGTFPDDTERTNPQFDTGGWHHYAVTWTNGGNFVGYFDGQPVFTNAMAGQTSLDIKDEHWLAIGTWKHQAGPVLDPAGINPPNCCWFGGLLDEARIYNTNKTAAEIFAIYIGSGAVDPQITNQPVSVSVGTNTTPTFTVAATGATALSYQWRLGGTAISGASHSTYTTPATVCADSGSQFTCTVSDTAGSVTSIPATLTITNCQSPPAVDIVITQQPLSTTVSQGSNAVFTVSATGGTTLHYAWSFAGVSVGSDSATYTRVNCQLIDNQQSVTVVVSDASGSLLSSTAKLTVVANAGSFATVNNLKVGKTYLRP